MRFEAMSVGVAVLLAVAWPGAAAAQGVAGALADARLLAQPAVRSGLGLDEAQARRLDDGLGKVREALSAKVREAARARRAGGPERLDLAAREVEAEAAAVVARVLSPAQASRYEQIKLQDRGPWALADPALQGKVGLAPAQAARVREIAADFQARVAALLRGRGGDQTSEDRGDLARRLQDLHDRAADELLALLDPSQRATWTGLLGEPFSFEAAGAPR